MLGNSIQPVIPLRQMLYNKQIHLGYNKQTNIFLQDLRGHKADEDVAEN